MWLNCSLTWVSESKSKQCKVNSPWSGKILLAKDIIRPYKNVGEIIGQATTQENLISKTNRIVPSSELNPKSWTS